MTQQPSDFEAAKKNLTPEEYARILQAFNLRTMELSRLAFDVRMHRVEGTAEYIPAEEILILEHSDKRVVTQVGYRIVAKSGKSIIFKAEVCYTVTFETAQPIPAEFLTIYNRVTLPLTTYPYFRELMSNLVSRTGLPAFTLPLRKAALRPAQSDAKVQKSKTLEEGKTHS